MNKRTDELQPGDKLKVDDQIFTVKQSAPCIYPSLETGVVDGHYAVVTYEGDNPNSEIEVCCEDADFEWEIV